MQVFRASQVTGYNVPMKTSKLKHLSKLDVGMKGQESNEVKGNSFADLLRNAFYDLNSIELRKDNLMQKFITDPNSVDIHELTNAMAKAELSIGFARSIAEKVVGAYRDISNMR